jgi:extracellular elastinolytic metalloproteinase
MTLRWDGLSASPKWLAAPPGESLSEPSGLEPEAAARAYLELHADLLGITKLEIADLELTSAVPARGDGVHLYFTQRLGGLEVYEGRVNINLGPDGAVRFLGSRLHAGVELPSDAILSVAEAVYKAALDVYPDRAFLGEVLEVPGPDSVERKTTFAEPEFGRPPRARLILFPQGDGTRLAWEVRIAEPSFETDYRTLIDARDGRILARHNMVFYADARVLLATQPEPESEEWAPAQHQLVEIPAGWLGGDDTTLAGNNAVSILGLPGQPGLSEPDGVYDYDFNTNESALVNAWYWVNQAHDRFYALGFDEPAGNFQEDNFGNGGAEGDPVNVRATFRRLYGRPAAYMLPGLDGEPGGRQLPYRLSIESHGRELEPVLHRFILRRPDLLALFQLRERLGVRPAPRPGLCGRFFRHGLGGGALGSSAVHDRPRSRERPG